MERLPELLPLLRTADEDEPERTEELPEERTALWAELRVVAALLVEEALRVDAVLLVDDALLVEEVPLETEALRDAEADREKDDTREEPAIRYALLLRVPDPKADVPLMRRKSP